MAVKQTTIPPRGHGTALAIVVNEPAALGDELYVYVPSSGLQRSLVRGWAAKTPLPLPDDICLVEYDENGDPWVVAWESDLRAPRPPLVSALPSEPSDGQEVYFQDATLAAQGVVWHLRYRVASASAHKWELVGGSEWTEGAATAVSEGSAVAFASTVLPPLAFAVPLAGDYDVWATGTPWSASALTDVRLSIGNTALTRATEITLGWAETASSYSPMSNNGRITGLAAGEELHLLQAYSASKVKISWTGKTLRVRPVRVG